MWRFIHGIAILFWCFSPFLVTDSLKSLSLKEECLALFLVFVWMQLCAVGISLILGGYDDEEG